MSQWFQSQPVDFYDAGIQKLVPQYNGLNSGAWAARKVTLSEEPVLEKQKKGWRMSCHIGEALEGLENEL